MMSIPLLLCLLIFQPDFDIEETIEGNPFDPQRGLAVEEREEVPVAPVEAEDPPDLVLDGVLLFDKVNIALIHQKEKGVRTDFEVRYYPATSAYDLTILRRDSATPTKVKRRNRARNRVRNRQRGRRRLPTKPEPEQPRREVIRNGDIAGYQFEALGLNSVTLGNEDGERVVLRMFEPDTDKQRGGTKKATKPTNAKRKFKRKNKVKERNKRRSFNAKKNLKNNKRKRKFNRNRLKKRQKVM